MDVRLNRRGFLSLLGGLAVSAWLPGRAAAQGAETPILRAVTSTGERMPVIGMGSWITFNVGRDRELRNHRVRVLQAFFDRGGGMIDSSPMYGSSEEVIGYCLERIDNTRSLVAATKVWSWLHSRGLEQMRASRRLWGVEQFDVMQVHNLVGWEDYLPTLLEHKDNGRIRYIGVTTSHGRRHAELERIMANEPIDFVQLTYNIRDREAEQRLLPLAAERGLGVIVNRPFRRKQLIREFEQRPLPAWAAEIDCANWPQFLLKYIVSNPAVTCAIPATSRVDHMHENMGALYGRLPDAAMRERMVRYVGSL
ncbi:aldo/keto reductase [Arhodomonas sp. AD133]|uniref:aldo/keto reductase n=1 Tax=Arhodomonas sp. AD133 TaxID=3415009 RepID=UPI003EBDD291